MKDESAGHIGVGASAEHPGAGAGLTNDALKAAGLAKVYAFVRAEASANALRVRKAREKAADEGSRQVNVVVPIAAHRAIKAMAKELQEGASVTEALTALLTAEVAATHPRVVVRVMSAERAGEVDALAARVAALQGWRLRLARWIGAA